MARNDTIQGTIKNVEKVFITNGADLAATLDVTKLGAQLQEAWQVTSAKNVSEVTAQTVGFKNIANVGVNVGYGANQATGTVVLDNSAAATGITLTGAKLATVSVAGSVKAADATTAGTVKLIDGTTPDTIKTLNLNLSNNATLDVTGLDALTTIVSTGAGDLGLGVLESQVKSVTTGAGKDVFTLATETTATVSATANTGAGNDTITVNTASTAKAGTVTVNAGEGDDSIIFSRALNVRDKVDGGAGNDTLSIRGTALIAEDYEVLKAAVSNVETLKFSQAVVAADASKLAQFSGFSFVADGSSIKNVADAQSIKTTADVAVTAAGYVAKDSGATPAVAATTYAGTLKVSAEGGAAASLGDDGVVGGTGLDEDVAQNDVVVTANSSAVNLNVAAGAATAAAAGSASFVSLTGDVQTATVNLVNSVNAATTATATADAIANFTLITGNAVNAGGAFTSLGGLTSLTLTGNGAATVSNTTGSKLATVDASGMTGVAAYDVTKVVGGLTFTALDTLAETVTLGGGLDKVTTVATYDKIDTITGFSLVAQAGSTIAVDTAKSDDLTITGYNGFAKATVTGDTLGLAFINAAANAENQVVFQFGGDTYAYVDRGATDATANGVLDNNDIAVKLTGVVDLDLMVSALNA